MLVQQLFNGFTLGMAYALIAVGYSLVFGILRLVNFSHGAIYAFGAKMAMIFIGMQFGVIPGIAAAMLLTGILGILIDKVSLEPLRIKKSPPIASLITTIGISNIITNLLIVFNGSEKRNFDSVFSDNSVAIGELSISMTQIMICVVSLALMGIFMLLVFKTGIGLAMRACEQNAKTANRMGINVNFIILIIVLIVRPHGLFGRKGVNKV